MPKRPSLRCSYLRAWAPTLLPTWIDNGHYIQSRPSAGIPEGPSGQTVPPVSFHPTGRFIVYNIALSIMWRLHCHASCYAAGYRRLPSAAAACAPTRRHSSRQPQRSAAFGLWSGRGGRLAVARPGNVLRRRTGLRRYAAAGDGSLPSASRSSPAAAMCSSAARLSHCASWRQATNGTWPLLDSRHDGARESHPERCVGWLASWPRCAK